MVHYATIMSLIGPLCYVSSMRFESFHRIFKNVIKNITNRRSILESYAFKIKMRYAKIFLNFTSLRNANFFTQKRTETSGQNTLKMYQCDFPLNECIFVTKHLEIHSVQYKVGNIIQDDVERDSSPLLILIKDIFLMGKQIFLGCQSVVNVGFDHHFCAYKVELEDFFS